MGVSRLLVVDDQLMLAEALAARLASVTGLWIVGQCTTSDQRLSTLVTQARPDVVTIDVEPVGTATGRLVCWLKEKRPSMHVVVLTGRSDVRLAVDAARAGAAAWVPKQRSAEELTGVLLGVCDGHAWFPPDVLGSVLKELRADARRAERRDGPLEVLSDRERDVLLKMVDGKRGDQIAEELVISVETVRTHTRRILAKLHVHSQLEAVSIACAAGMRASDARDGSVVPPPDRW